MRNIGHQLLLHTNDSTSRVLPAIAEIESHATILNLRTYVEDMYRSTYPEFSHNLASLYFGNDPEYQNVSQR